MKMNFVFQMSCKSVCQSCPQLPVAEWKLQRLRVHLEHQLKPSDLHSLRRFGLR